MFKKFFCFFFIILVSCTSTNKINKVQKIKKLQSPEVLYQSAINEYEKGQLQNSVDILKKLEINYSYSNFAPKTILMIAYIYYEANDYINSLKYSQKFKELYPSNKNFVYAEFLTALCFYDQINNISKDQEPTLLALKQFEKILKQYPKTDYAEESKIRIDLLNAQLAGNAIYNARYYMNKEKWTPAILYLQIVIEKYPTTVFVDEALHRIVEVNYKLGNLENAKKYAAILGYNFNTSDWYKRTYKIVGDKNYSITNVERKKSLKEKLISIFSFNKND